MELSKPLVSVCMATCLRADLFPESLAGLLRQTYLPLEIVVLADGSDAGSLELLKNCGDARIRWITTPRPSGMIPAWNLVVRETRGKYFLFCADDDVLLDRAIDRQVELMEAHDEVGFCHADFLFIDDDGKEINRWESHRGEFIDDGAKVWPDYLVGTQCCMQTTVVRKTCWDEVGGWDNDAGNPGDNSLYLKLLRIGSVGHVPQLACKYRIRTRKPDSWEKKFANQREYYALAIKHLSKPPSRLRVSIARVRRRLMSRMARACIELDTSAPSNEERQRLREWLNENIWPGSPFGKICSVSNQLGIHRWLTPLVSVENRLRRAAKRVALELRHANH